MPMNVEHFRYPSEQTIHLFRHPAETAVVRSIVREASDNLHYHLAILDGRSLDSEEAVLKSIAQLYDFPKESGPNYENMNWNGANDWLGDLTWITGFPRGGTGVNGFLLLYLDPMVLFLTDTAEFATLLDVVGSSSQWHRKENTAFHFVIGPVDYRAELFIRMLRVSNLLCKTCMNTDV